VTPARVWSVTLDGVGHRIEFAPGLVSDRPETILCDGYRTAVDWRRVGDPSGRKDRGTYRHRATFVVAGHRAAIDIDTRQPSILEALGASWRAQFEQGKGTAIFWLVMHLIALIIGTPGFGPDTTIGKTTLTINGRVVEGRAPHGRPT
jgi:hypothetical protein